MHSVFRFLENHRGRGFEHLVRHLHLADSEPLSHFFSNLRFQIMESRKTVHENRPFPGIVHYLFIDLIRGQFPDSLLPDILRLAHGHPHIRVNHIGVLRPGLRILRKGNCCPRLFRNGSAFVHKRLFRKIFCGSAGCEMHSQLCAYHHQ